MSDAERDPRREPEEDLTEGPTPTVRRAEGEPEEERDTSDGPTPETREAERQ
jgi:hypothetical protein